MDSENLVWVPEAGDARAAGRGCLLPGSRGRSAQCSTTGERAWQNSCNSLSKLATSFDECCASETYVAITFPVFFSEKPLNFEITSLLLHALNLMLQFLKHLETLNGSLSCRSFDISKEPLGGVAGLLSEDLKAVDRKSVV